MTFAKVIRILDQYTIMIDKGFETLSGIKEGEKITIFEPGPEIKDLDGNILGNYDFKKADLIITEVYSKFSIAQNIEKQTAFSVTNLLAGNQIKGTLNVNEKEINPLKPNNPKIQLGDLVKII